MTEDAGATSPPLSAEAIDRLASELNVGRDVIRTTLAALADRASGTAGDELSVAETAFLNAHSGTRSNRGALIDAMVKSEIEQAADRAEALTVAEAAAFLSVGLDDIEHMLLQGTVYAYPSAGPGPRFVPRWQFVGSHVVPHLGEVLSALPAHFTPLDVRAFVMNARIDHTTDDLTSGLIDWLTAGNDPVAAIGVAQSQNYTL